MSDELILGLGGLILGLIGRDIVKELGGKFLDNIFTGRKNKRAKEEENRKAAREDLLLIIGELKGNISDLKEKIVILEDRITTLTQQNISCETKNARNEILIQVLQDKVSGLESREH